MLRTFLRSSAGLAFAVAFLLAPSAQAALIVGFEFAGGATNQIVPATGGTFTVNIVATTDNVATTNIGVNAGYIGALSQVLNSSTIDGDITARTLTAGLGSQLGLLAERNADNRADLGNLDGIAKSNADWMRPTTGGVTAVLLGAPKGIIGTFTVTIPANAGGGGNFLSYVPQLNPSGAGNDWQWTENNTATTLLSGSIGTTVSVGTSVTFASAVPIPEPGTYALGSILLAGLAGLKLRRKTTV